MSTIRILENENKILLESVYIIQSEVEEECDSCIQTAADVSRGTTIRAISEKS